MVKFSKNEQNAIEEKYEQLKKVCSGLLSHSELAEIITKRRINWLKENLNGMLEKYKNLSPEEQAYRIIYFDHMKIDPEHSKMIRISPTKIKIESYNFCPYLEASNQLNLDTRCICKEIGEPSIQKMCEIIDHRLRFLRNYDNIRPLNGAFCEEYIEIISVASDSL
ncbi:MAG: hypothetical protein ABH830_00990 [Patescibacteria group bacterium]